MKKISALFFRTAVFFAAIATFPFFKALASGSSDTSDNSGEAPKGAAKTKIVAAKNPTSCSEVASAKPEASARIQPPDSPHPDPFAIYNLRDFVKNPANFLRTTLGAAQKLNGLIAAAGYKIVLEPSFAERPVKKWTLLHVPSDQNNGIVLHGNYSAGDSFKEWAAAAARGERGGTNKGLLFIGPSGTGKSIFADLVSGILGAQAQKGPQNNLAYFYWTGMGGILNQGPYRYVTDLDYVMREVPQSPLLAIPEAIRKPIEQGLYAEASVFTESSKPFSQNLVRSNQFVIRQIIDHYTRQAGRTLSPEEQLDAIDRHLQLVPAPPDAFKDMVIQYQGEVPDVKMLIGQTNPLAASQGNGQHPLASEPGKLIRVNGGLVFLDELLRNSPEFLQFLLSFIEGGRIEFGAVSEFVDTLKIAGTNDESWKEVAERGGLKAILDRVRTINLLLPEVPSVITQVLLGSSGTAFEARPLGKNGLSDYTTVSLATLIPDREKPSDPYPQIDRNWSLRVKRRPGVEVYLAPHVIEFIAGLVAVSRMETNPALLIKRGIATDLLNSPYLSSEIRRWRVYVGEDRNVPRRNELADLIDQMGGGRSGISNREMTDILWQSVLSAAENSPHKTVTPFLVDKIVRNLVGPEDAIARDNYSLKILIIKRLNEFSTSVIKQRIFSDISEAIGATEKSIGPLYDEFLAMINAKHLLDQDTYEFGGQTLQYNPELAEAIGEEYHSVNGTEFVPKQLVLFGSQSQSLKPSSDNDGDESYMHPYLRNAIVSYLRKKASNQLDERALLTYVANPGNADMDPAKKGRCDYAVEYLINKLGYNLKAIKDALQMIRADMRTVSEK